MPRAIWIIDQLACEAYQGIEGDAVDDLKRQIREEIGEHVPVIVLPPGCSLDVLYESDDEDDEDDGPEERDKPLPNVPPPSIAPAYAAGTRSANRHSPKAGR